MQRCLASIVVLASVLAAGVSLFVATMSPPVAPRSFTLRVDGVERRYFAWSPGRSDEPRPVLFAFHGTFGDPESFVRRARLDRLAREKNALLIAPAATRGMWFVDPPAGEAESADVRFFDVLLDDVASRFTIDRDRMYVVGMSNGGAFTHRLAVDRSESVTAAVACAGHLPPSDTLIEVPAPILFVVGDEDRQADVETARGWVDRIREAGGEAELRKLPGVGHVWVAGTNESAWQFLSRARIR